MTNYIQNKSRMESENINCRLQDYRQRGEQLAAWSYSARAQYQILHVLDMCWICFHHVLDMPGMFRTLVRHVSGMFWTCCRHGGHDFGSFMVSTYEINKCPSHARDMFWACLTSLSLSLSFSLYIYTLSSRAKLPGSFFQFFC